MEFVDLYTLEKNRVRIVYIRIFHKKENILKVGVVLLYHTWETFLIEACSDSIVTSNARNLTKG